MAVVLTASRGWGAQDSPPLRENALAPGGEGSTAVRVYLVPPNRTLQNVYVGKAYVMCFFWPDLKKKIFFLALNVHSVAAENAVAKLLLVSLSSHDPVRLMPIS